MNKLNVQLVELFNNDSKDGSGSRTIQSGDKCDVRKVIRDPYITFKILKQLALIFVWICMVILIVIFV